MVSSNNKFPVMIQTNNGDVPIDTVEIGDTVYEYGSGQELKVLGTTSKTEEIFKVKFNDGRISYYSKGELEHLQKTKITQYAIEYNNDKVVAPLNPDPYIAGALLIYGDQTDKYINLPFDVLTVNNLLSDKYQLNYGGTVSENGNRYFTYDGAPKDQLITWEEFFPNMQIPATKANYEMPPLVPLEYLRASVEDRLKFLRGVFDMGYSEELFADTCGAAHTSGDGLLEVQKMLWSLGILSILEYDTTNLCIAVPDKMAADTPQLTSAGGSANINITFKLPSSYKEKDYRLYILGKHSKYPGYFYDVDSIENMIDGYNKPHKYLKFKLQIKSVDLYTRTKVSNIILEKEYMKYLTSNFLPKISARK